MENPKLSTPDLFEMAEYEVMHFALPDAWQKDRTKRKTVVIDSDSTYDHDDALSCTALGNNEFVARVSIADAGSFVPDLPYTFSHAERVGRTFYKQGAPTRPMLPHKLSEDILSLIPGQERPALTVHLPLDALGRVGPISFSRDAVTSRGFTYDEANAALTSGQPSELDNLLTTAKMLHAARHNISPTHIKDIKDSGLSYFIVSEHMIAANTALAKFAHQNNIPTLLRTPKDDGNAWELTQNVDASLTTQFSGPYTSPLRKLPDLLNISNLTAFLDNKSYPYSLAEIEAQVHRCNNLIKTRRARLGIGQFASELLVRLETHKSHPADLATILLNKTFGTDEEKAIAKAKATKVLQANPAISNEIVKIALNRGWLNSREGMITDEIGRAYEFSDRTRKQLGTSMAAVTLLSEITGVPLKRPNRHRTKEHNSRAAYLYALAKSNRILYSSRSMYAPTIEGDEERAKGVVAVIIDGTLYTHAATTQGANKAIQIAADQLVAKLGLEKRKLNVSPTVRYLREKLNSNLNPTVRLRGWASKARVAVPTFDAIVTRQEGFQYCTCWVTITDQFGKVHTAQGDGFNSKQAKAFAAEKLLAMLPSPKIKSQL